MRFLIILILFFSILSVDASTSTKAISVNFFNQPGNNEEISQYGAPSYSTVDGWINTTDGNIANATLDDGRETSVDISAISVGTSSAITSANPPGPTAAYDGTPLNAWIKAGVPTYLNNGNTITNSDEEAHVTIDNLNEVFPSGYDVIVYLNGDPKVGSAAIYLTENGGSDDWNSSTDSFFTYKTLWNANAFLNNPTYNGIPVLTTHNADLNTSPLAQYAVFSSISADKITLTLDTLASNGGGAGISGIQIIGLVANDYTYGQTDIPAGSILYNDFSHYSYKSLSLPSGGTANPTYHNRNTGKYIGGASRGVFVKAKRNPYAWNDASTWFVNHSYAYKFGSTNAVNSKFVAPSDSTGGTALKVGYHGPRKSTTPIICNTGIKFDPTLNYTVTIRAKIKDEVDSGIISNAVGNISLSAGFGNLARMRNPYAAINQAVTNSLTSTNWTEVSVDVYGGKLSQKAIFGEYAYDSNGFGPNGLNFRVPGNQINLDNYYPQELMVSIGRSPDSTNTLDHSTWVDWIKIETNNYLESIAHGYGLSSTNLLGDTDSDGQNDLVEIATGGNPTNSSLKGAGLSIIRLQTTYRPIYETNNISILPNQNNDGEVAEIITYPLTNFVLVNDAKYGSTNLISEEHRFGGTTWTNYVEYVVDSENESVIKWKDTVEEIIDLSLSNYSFEVTTLNDSAHVTNNNVFVNVDIIGSYTNSLDNGVDVISSLITNEILVTKVGELDVIGSNENSIVRFKRPRSKEINRLGCKYSIASRDALNFGSWTNSGAFDFGNTYNASNYPNIEMGASTAPVSSDTGFLQLRVSSPGNDPSSFYFDTFSDTDYGIGDPGN